MINKEQLLELINSTETWRVEKTISTTNTDKFCQAICAFANDLPNSKLNGFLLIGVKDNGELDGLKITDELMKNISAIRSDGNILPLPTMTVTPFSLEKGDVLVVEVTPSLFPPVRYRGRTYVRIGPRKDFATIEEERLLSERVTANYPTFDTMPCIGSSLDDLDIKLFETEYLPNAILEDENIIDTRNIKEKMAALRLFDMCRDCPTNAAIILFGKNPKQFMFGNYIQFVRFTGKDRASDISNEYEFKGGLLKMLPLLETFIETSIIQKRPVSVSLLREKTIFNYPKWAIRELIMNAVMHRDYQSNMPTKFYQYSNRLEISNAGGLFGNANVANFPNVNDYRNPIIAEAMKILGYVNKYNRGIARVNGELEENGNGKAHFEVSNITVFDVFVCDAKTIDDELYDGLSNQACNQDNHLEDSVLPGIYNQDDNQVKRALFPQWSKDLTNESKKILLLAFTPITKNEIFNRLGISKQTNNSNKYFKPLITIGLLEITIKGKTTSPNQKYCITLLGKEFVEYLEKYKK